MKYRVCTRDRLRPPPPTHQARDVSPAVGDTRTEMPEMPKIRILVAIDCYGDGLCVAESISHHRACSAVVESFEGGPTAALRALADAIDAEADRYSTMPD